MSYSRLHTRTTAAAGPTKAYRRPPSRDSQQLQGKEEISAHSHQEINTQHQINGAQTHTVVLSSSVKGVVPYAVVLLENVLQGESNAKESLKHCLCIGIQQGHNS